MFVSDRADADAHVGGTVSLSMEEGGGRHEDGDVGGDASDVGSCRDFREGSHRDATSGGGRADCPVSPRQKPEGVELFKREQAEGVDGLGEKLGLVCWQQAEEVCDSRNVTKTEQVLATCAPGRARLQEVGTRAVAWNPHISSV